MSKFKIGDTVRVRTDIGVIDIWVKPGKEYVVRDIVVTPAEPADKCYRNCGDPMHDPKPKKYWLVVDGQLGKPATIFEGCFEAVTPVVQ